MDSQMKNTQELQEFVRVKKLRNKYSQIDFEALVEIKTSANHLEIQNSKIQITFDGYDNYGTVTLLDGDIDSNLYPTVLLAKYQDFVFVKNEYLRITGFHRNNPSIGKYSVTITPL